LIDWSKSNKEIHNLVRGICRSPSAYFVHNGKIIKVIETKPVDGNGTQGQIISHSKEGVDIGCSDGLIRLITVKPEGKGEMKASDWYNGVRK
jgi:methionyl-tRNA formyltransferase